MYSNSFSFKLHFSLSYWLEHSSANLASNSISSAREAPNHHNILQIHSLRSNTILTWNIGTICEKRLLIHVILHNQTSLDSIKSPPFEIQISFNQRTYLHIMITYVKILDLPHSDPPSYLSTMATSKVTSSTVPNGKPVSPPQLLEIPHLFLMGWMIKFWRLLYPFPRYKIISNLGKINEFFNLLRSNNPQHNFTRASLHLNFHYCQQCLDKKCSSTFDCCKLPLVRKKPMVC